MFIDLRKEREKCKQLLKHFNCVLSCTWPKKNILMTVNGWGGESFNFYFPRFIFLVSPSKTPEDIKRRPLVLINQC